MKINLVNIHKGLNHLKFLIKSQDLGFDEKDEAITLFPNDLYVDVEIQQFSDKYFIKVDLITVAYYNCDRCLATFDQNLETTFQLIYSKHKRDVFEDDEYRFLGEKETEIDLSADVRENLLLVIPMKRLCNESCRGLCIHCGANLNHETCNCKQDTIDPRWEKLKSIQFNN